MPLAFGTSGIRGLATDFTTDECAWLVRAFIKHLEAIGTPAREILIAGDFRESTPRLLAQIEAALRASGCASTYCGLIPTPALAYACIVEQKPGIMVTGSHIPADRNGIKFYFDSGEILKKDEAAIFDYYQKFKSQLETPALELRSLCKVNPFASQGFVQRYVDMFGPGALAGVRTLFFEHSSAAKHLLPEILEKLGATVVRFGATAHFTPVDTENVENVDELKAQLAGASADALISTDGDADRPMMVAENGELIPGDLIGLIAARALGAREIVVPVSCNTALEMSGHFEKVHRTRIGSPYVLEKMLERGAGKNSSAGIVIGFEANGGFFHAPLLTRDSILPILLVLAEIKRQGRPLSQILADLPPRFTASGLIRNVPAESSRKILEKLGNAKIGNALAPELAGFGAVMSVDRTDGLRFTLAKSPQSAVAGGIVHFRPSGNAPEFRVYAESSTREEARALCQAALMFLGK
ncbi:MAG TPA: phosphomannomutase [Bdellovibrionales bacterium]|nr:MAG: hypothetical protein A2X97_10605 [Bdellovibrionales bacterium GWA1_52_35]HAR44117.1 phosphomannomutase [Bdellovibrionales bacterium]HCM38634.1 phosphomannomutase [Bdellovibrionales bacterium]